MSADSELRCHWSESVDGVHELCPAEAVFAVEVEYAVENGMQRGRLHLCAKHAPQVPAIGLAGPRPPA